MVGWIKRWNVWTAPKASLPGVWRRKNGGFLVRGRARDPLTKKRMDRMFVVDDTNDPAVAFEQLQAELRAIREGATEDPTSLPPLFCDFSVSLLEEKINDGSIRSVASQKKWQAVLKNQLIPAFGEMRVDEIRRLDVMGWRAKIAKEVRSPHTGNDWLSVLRVIMAEVVERHELDRDPMHRVANLDTRTHRTYTREKPNSLTVNRVPSFLAAMGEEFPEFLAITTLGFATGLRPSSMRPLRRRGPNADVLWSEGILLIRRSHTEGRQPIDMTKTARDQEVRLPKDLLEVLQWHVDRLPEGPMKESELLFPAEDGLPLNRHRLRWPFEVVCDKLELSFRLTPRGMRRTFQDLARAAQLHDFVTRAVSGHATEAMQARYSTVSSAEVEQGLAKVIELTGAKGALEATRGVHRGVHGHKSKKAG